ncbi:MAG: response regulator [Candidatus Xenobiia bacterium LiM19]
MKEKRKILIVEDEILTARMISNQLATSGYSMCKSATNGEDALRTAENENPHMILMDIRLAGTLDGIEVAERILSNKRIPIVFMSGFSSAAIIDRASQLNPLAYLIKPFNLAELQSIVDSYFETAGAVAVT